VHAIRGRPVEEICRLASELQIDLIVMPTRGRTGLKHLALGSTAERVVRHAPCPVLVLHPKDGSRKRRQQSLKKVLVPVDFSPCSATGLEYAKALAQEFKSKLVLLNSVDLHYYSTNPEYVLYDFSPLFGAAEEAARTQMRELVEGTDWGGLNVETLLKSGHAGDQICRRAEECGVELIVTSTHGRTGLKHIFIGSTAEYVVRHASCPVLVVPSHPRTPFLTRKASRR
jgi:nucleotide-binding universal stress UspA family protein